MREKEELFSALSILQYIWEKDPTQQEFVGGIIVGLKWALGDVEDVLEGVASLKREVER